LKIIFEPIKDANQEKLNPEYYFFKKVQEEKTAWFKNQEDFLYAEFGSFRNSYKYEQLYWSKKLNTDSVFIWQIKNRQPDADADSITIAAHKTLQDYLPYLPADTLKTITHASNDFEDDAKTKEPREAEERLPLQNAQIIIDHNDPGWFRKNTVHDDPYTNDNRFYGNNNPLPHGSSHHGTFCAGIIAANNNTNKYGNGIANNVLIMPVREYPDSGKSDEWDKDIANSIRYAVDNGAKVINMSFDKSHSPQKKWVDDAIMYARKKGVLLIRAAGNKSNDIDKKHTYPSAYDDNNKRFDNFITVGASNYNSALVAAFSNYGKENVDVFAPGVAIWSLADGDSCSYWDGTSFSTPMVSGLAALIWSYYPKLTYKDIRYCIEKSATPINTVVTKPGTKEKIFFSSLSRTGGIVNAYKAIMIAEEMMKKK
jgi:subtilisin family serine protease